MTDREAYTVATLIWVAVWVSGALAGYHMHPEAQPKPVVAGTPETEWMLLDTNRVYELFD